MEEERCPFIQNDFKRHKPQLSHNMTMVQTHKMKNIPWETHERERKGERERERERERREERERGERGGDGQKRY